MHTPGPWEWAAGDVGQDYSHRYCDVFIDGGNTIIANVNERAHGQEAIDHDNARLIAAACTSYDRAFGPAAVEAAEADWIKDAIYALKEAERIGRALTNEAAGVAAGGQTIPWLDRIRAILARAEGVGRDCQPRLALGRYSLANEL